MGSRRSTDFIAQDDPVLAIALRMMRDHSRLGIGVPEAVERVGVPRQFRTTGREAATRANQTKSISRRVTEAGWTPQTRLCPTLAISSLGSTACG